VTVRRRKFFVAVLPLALLTLLPTVQAGAELGPPAEAGGGGGEGGNGFHGFAQFDTHAQSQVATLTGFLNAFREDNSLVGALSEINGPPGSSRNITALFQRGKGATFVYGVIGGQGGGRGTLPDPPPGEANAFYPTGPFDTTWSGPVTGLGIPQVVDSRFDAKATEEPTGRTSGAVTALESPNHFKVGQATVAAHTEPADGGVVAEGVSVVHQVEVGPLTIQNIVSRAFAFVPSTGDPKGVASTVVEGAKVGDTPVQITDKGIVVAETVNPLQQEQVNKAMADAGFPQVRLLPSVAKSGEDGASVNATAGTLEFIKHDEAFGASNPQGFSGGGFSIGGADAYVNTRRCDPDCGGGTAGSSDVVGGGTGDSPISGDGTTDGSSSDSLSSDTLSSDDFSSGSSGATPAGTAGGYGADSAATFSTDTSGAGLGGSGNLSSGSGGGPGGAATTSGSSTATTPSGSETALGVTAPGTGVEVQTAAFTNLGPKSAEWVRDLYLMAALGLGLIFVGQRLARAFS
jgi:hypothetical protein